MATEATLRCELQINNDQQGLPAGHEAALTYAWIQRTEAAVGAFASQGGYSLPPGGGGSVLGSAFRVSDPGYTCPPWYMRKRISIPSSTPIGPRTVRILNGHIGGGYPGWNSTFAYSVWALDANPPGTSPQTGVVHASPYLQFNVGGGGTYDPSIDWYHSINQHWYEVDIAYDTEYYIRGVTVFAPDGTGSAVFTINGAAWFSHSGPTYVAGVPGYGGTLGQNWVNVWEGGYQACGGNYSLERHEIIDQSVSRAALTLGGLDTDAPGINFGDHSVPIVSGALTSGIVLLGTSSGTAGYGAAGTAPVATGLPVISGSVAVGQILTATNGTWSGAPTSFSVQWQRSPDGTDGSWTNVTVAGSYTLVAADLGYKFRVIVTATNATDSGTATSASTAAVKSTTGDDDQRFGHYLRSDTARPLDMSANRKRGNEFFNGLIRRVDSFGITLLGDGVGQQTGHVFLHESDGAGNPGNLILVSNNITITGGDPAQVYTIAVPSNPVLAVRWYLLGFHSGPPTGAELIIQGFFDDGLGLLLNNADAFADGTSNPFGVPSKGDGVLNVWANVTPIHHTADATGGNITGADGGAVSYATLEAAASDAARETLLEAVNPSRAFAVHRNAVDDFTTEQRKLGEAYPSGSWWSS